MTETHAIFKVDETNLKQLRRSINDISDIAVGLHKGSKESSFDQLQKKIGQAIKAFAYHEHDMVALKHDANSVAKENKKYQSERAKLVKKLTEMELENSKVESSIKNAERDSMLLSKQKQSLENSINWEKQLRKNYESQLAKMEDSIEAQNAKIKVAQNLTESNLKKLHEWLADERLKNAALRDMNTELQNSISELQNNVDKLTKEADELKYYKTQYQQLSLKVEKLQNDNQTIQANNNENVALLSKQQSSNAELEKKFEELQAQYKLSQSQNAILTEQFNQVNNKLEETEKQLMMEENKSEQMLLQNEEMENTLTHKRGVCASLEIELNSMSTALAAKKSLIGQLQQENEKLKEKVDFELNQTKTSYMQKETENQNKFNKAVSALISEKQQLNDQINQLKNEEKELKNEYVKLVALLEKEQSKCNDVSLSKQLLQEKIDILKQDLERVTRINNDFDKSIKNLQITVNEKNKIISAKDKIIQLQRKENKDLVNDLSNARKFIEMKDEKLFDLQNVADKLEANSKELVSVKSQNALLKSQINGLKQKYDIAKNKIEILDEKVCKQRANYKILLDKDTTDLNHLADSLNKSQKEICEQSEENLKLKQELQQQTHRFQQEKQMYESMIEKLKCDFEYELQSNENRSEISEKHMKSLDSKTHLLNLEIEKRDRLLAKLSTEIAKLKAELAIKSEAVPVWQQDSKSHKLMNIGSKIE